MYLSNYREHVAARKGISQTLQLHGGLTNSMTLPTTRFPRGADATTWAISQSSSASLQPWPGTTNLHRGHVAT